jgi:hypothetical protein
MPIPDSGKVALTRISPELRDLSDPEVRLQIADKAQRDAEKTVARLLRRRSLQQAG